MTDSRPHPRERPEPAIRVADADHDYDVRIQLLGTFMVGVGDRDLDESAWRLRKASHLLKLLALAPGRRRHREQVMDALWPHLSPDAAANNLYYALHVARRTLDPDPEARDRYLHSARGELILEPEGAVWVDTEAFETLAAHARESGDPRVYRDALALYGGDLLPQDMYEEWTIEPRETLRKLFLQLLLDLARLHEARGELDLAIESFQRLVTLTPADEVGHVGLMRLYAATGLRHQALRQYDVLRTTLQQELDIAPASESVNLYQYILSGRQIDLHTAKVTQEAEPSAQASPVSTNLPAPLTSFVGRQPEIAELRSLLARCRLLTLTGPGGIGKTRLALASVRNDLEQFPDGVLLVSFAPVRRAEFVLPAIAQVLGAREGSGRSLLQSVTEAIGEKRMLLILDNVEHLADAGPILIRLLETCQNLKLLLTSRVRLRLHGEQEYPVEPLATTETPHLARDDIARVAAVELFVHRAREVQPKFQLTVENAAAVAEIARRLDGLPLAIELAVARVNVLPPAAILERLDHPLNLLTSGSRDLPARQQTIRDTISWSYDLLESTEQWDLCALSVFVGGWTLKAAGHVLSPASTPPLDDVLSDRFDVLDRLSSLVDHSFVRRFDVADEPRFSMLEVIREFALETLVESGELDRVRERHARYYMDLATRGGDEILGPDEGWWLARLDREIGNFRAVLEWCSSGSGNPEVGLRLAGALWMFWDISGRFGEARRWLLNFLSRVPGETESQAKAHFALGYLATRQGDPVSARPALEHSLSIYRKLDNRSGESRVLAMLGALASFEGDFSASTSLLEEALAAFRDTGDRLGIARTLLDLGDQVRSEGDYERATRLLSESLQHFQDLKIPRGAGWALTNLGNTARAVGDLKLARTQQEESRAIFAELGDKRGLARPVLYLANLARLSGDSDTARQLFHESLELLRELQDQWRLTVWLYYIGLTASQYGDHERATQLFAAAAASHERFDTLLDPAERHDMNRAIQRAREALGDERFRLVRATGEELDLEAAIVLALRVLDS